LGEDAKGGEKANRNDTKVRLYLAHACDLDDTFVIEQLHSYIG